MEFGIYSEYPTEENIKNIRYLKSPVEVVVAAPSLRAFREHEKRFEQEPNVGEVRYWPQLSRDEGYWISPFSDEEGLERVFREIESRDGDSKLLVMLDLEPPFLVNKGQMVSGLKGFGRKKKRIIDFINSQDEKNVEILTAELPAGFNPLLLTESGLEDFGLLYNGTVPYDRTRMAYTSFHKNAPRVLGKIPERMVQWMLRREAEKARENGSGISLGCLARGPLQNRGLLTQEELDSDLRTVKEADVDKVHLYNLRGMTPEFAEVLEAYN